MDTCSEDDDLKFAVDCMLGKLAKTLRILGFDTFYKQYIDDSELVNIAYEQNRIILTRDVELTKRKKAIKYLLIKDTDHKKQVKQLIKQYSDIEKFKKPLTRCLICNSILKSIEKQLVENLVPKYTYQNIEKFYVCPKCKKIYWSATHIDSMKKQYDI